MSEEKTASPCIRICCLDLQEVCVGCYRTLREIREWHEADEDRKREILANCEKRRADSLARQRSLER